MSQITPSPLDQSNMEYDLIGIGFGPANLSVAIALVEKWEAAKKLGVQPQVTRVCFVEKYGRFAWHPGMLLPGAQMQISFLKDLATLRNPNSPFTFLSYLHEHNRLAAFINRSSFTPTRREFADYLTWASAKVQEHEGIEVVFGEEVTRVDAGLNGDTVTLVSRSIKSGKESFRSGRNLIISPGGQPRIPAHISPIHPHPQIIHTSSYVDVIPRILSSLKSALPKRQNPLRIGVIGSGQSSAEVFLDLQSRLAAIPLPNRGRHQLDLIFRKGSLKPSDDSPFSNQIFDPESTDFVFGLPDEGRISIRKEYASTNYGVVNPTTLDAFYETIYDQSVVTGLTERDSSLKTDKDATKPLLNLLPYHILQSAEITSPCSSRTDEITLGLLHTLKGTYTERSYDALILGTGYERQSWADLLSQSTTLGAIFGLIPEPPKGGEGIAQQLTSCPHPNSPSPSSDVSTDESYDDHTEISTPPSPLSQVSTGLPSLAAFVPSRTKISRNYRLLPNSSSPLASAFKPAVYVQGCSEMSHGLSDTLLSVIGVRSAEIVDDLMRTVVETKDGGDVSSKE